MSLQVFQFSSLKPLSFYVMNSFRAASTGVGMRHTPPLKKYLTFFVAGNGLRASLMLAFKALALSGQLRLNDLEEADLGSPILGRENRRYQLNDPPFVSSLS